MKQVKDQAIQTVEDIIRELRAVSSATVLLSQDHFGVKGVNNIGLTVPKMRRIAKRIGRNHALSLQLWKTGIHEARHIAVMIADPKLVTEKQMEKWVRDFNSWDIVDGCCGTLFDKTPFAFSKAIEWSKRKPEFEKRAGFVLMAELAVHDKISEDKKFMLFFPRMIDESDDRRNFVKKAINWALRQIGKRNKRLCNEAIKVAKRIHSKGDPASRWIASDALRELQTYRTEVKIRNIGRKGGVTQFIS